MTRVLIAVTHLTGSGHLVRSLALARALRARGAEVAVLSGGRPLPHLGDPGVEVIQLPPVWVEGLDYARLHGADPETRGAVTTARGFAPDVIVTETWPFGRGALWGEFAALAAIAPRLVVSVRDIPEPPARAGKIARAEGTLARASHVLVHGDPAVTRFTDHWPLPAALADRLTHTGYVAEPMPPPVASDEVLVAVGGGALGRRLLAAAAEAAEGARRPWRLLVGGADAAEVAARLPGAEPARADYRARLAGAAASISLAGYNTACDLLACTTPAVLVPMGDGGEREQGLRAAALTRYGFRVLHDPDARALRAAVANAAPRPPAPVALDGADRSAALILQE